MAGLSLSLASTVILAAASAWPTVWAVVFSRRRSPASSMVIVFSVAMSTLRPWRPMPELRLVDSLAPPMSMPRAPTAWSTVVAVVQIVCGSPSTVKVTSRPNRTATCVPVVQFGVHAGSHQIAAADLDAFAVQHGADGAGRGAELLHLPVQ